MQAIFFSNSVLRSGCLFCKVKSRFVLYMLKNLIIKLTANKRSILRVQCYTTAFFIFLLTGLANAQKSSHIEPTSLSIGADAPNFNLKGMDGKFHTLASYKSSKVLVIVFGANHCPTAQAYEQRTIDIARDYKNKSVQVLVISSNSPAAVTFPETRYSDLGDSYADMIIRAKDLKFNFPYLYDGDNQDAALAYGPIATPHAFVFDANRKLVYSGRFDANEKPGTGNSEELRNALDATLAGKIPNPAVTKVFGCSMKWKWKNEYAKQFDEEWKTLPVTIEHIDSKGVKELLQNNSSKLRLINIWATWCGPCTMEFKDLVVMEKIYRERDFEFISISADKLEHKKKALNFLESRQAANKNYIFSNANIYDLIEAVDPNWKGAIPYTILVEPGGKIVYSHQGIINPLTIKKQIVEHKLLGRYY